MQRICVFAGSRPGKREQYIETARALGQELAARGLTLVYGGGGVGLMGAVADATLDADGQVIGVMPRGLFAAEAAHRQLTELRETGTMHERKRMMYDLADGYIGLPGGLGTFDELIEIITWAQIGIHHKPIVLLNVDDYFAPLVALVENAITEGFVEEQYRTLFSLATTPTEAIDRALALAATVDATAPKHAAGSLNEHVSANGHRHNGANGAANGRRQTRGGRAEQATHDADTPVEAPPVP